VEHGKSGFVWSTLDELKAFTRMLMDDEPLWQTMSAAARERARRFSRARFLEEMSQRAGVTIDDSATVRARDVHAPVTST
jgi:hypothetical protein